MLSDKIASWIIEKAPWSQYILMKELFGFSPDNPSLEIAYNKLLQYPGIKELLKELHDWPGPSMKRHNDAKLLYHKLVFLAETGLTSRVTEVERIVPQILSSISPEGSFQITGNIPTVFGGSGMDEPIWVLCDTPLITHALIKLGLAEDTRVKTSVEFLLAMIKDFGQKRSPSSWITLKAYSIIDRWNKISSNEKSN